MKYRIIILALLFITCFSVVFANPNIKIHSKAAVAMDADSGLVLYNKDMNKKIYPASTTKILTAILAIENIDINKSVVVSKTAIKVPWDSSTVYLKEGEVITVKDLLYCLLLNSGNDAANVLAEAVSGDINTFVKLMNQKTKELGCINTHFNNAHGYSNDNHYTTALDMAKIFRYCIQNDTFVDIISTKNYTVGATNKTNAKRILKNTNRLILQKSDSIYARFYEYCIGGKTGYTDEAGRTLVTFAKKDDKTIISAVFGASSNGNQDVRYTDAINLFEYSFNNFSKQSVAQAENFNFNYINVDKRLNYSIGLKNDLEVLLKNNESINTSYILNIDDTYLKALDETSKQQVPAGTITFNLVCDNGNSYAFEQTLYLKGIQKYSLIVDHNLLPILIISLVVILMTIIIVLVLCKRKSSISNSKSRKNRRNK